VTSFRYSQFPNRGFPLGGKPLLSFVAGIAVAPPVPPDPDRGYSGGGGGDYWAKKKRDASRIDADDFEMIVTAFVIVAGQVWRN